MRITLSFLLILLCNSIAFTQTVDSIRVEQAGDFIKVRYRILESKPGDSYRITILCSVNGGLYSEIKSVSGDVGLTVPGGKSEYLILWDVLNDIDELATAEFLVRAEKLQMQSDFGKPAKDWGKAQLHFHGILESNVSPIFGGRISYMGKWGVTAKFAIGTTETDYLFGSMGTIETVDLIGVSINGTARLIMKGGFSLHYFGGICYSTVRAYQEDSSGGWTGDIFDNYIGIDQGIIIDISYFSISAGSSMFLPGTKPSQDGYNLKGFIPHFGLGFRF